MHNQSVNISLTGKDIRPDFISAHEIAELMINFEQGLIAQIESMNPDIDKENLIISLVKIDQGSIKLKFSSTLIAVTLTAFTVIANSIKTNNISKLSNKTTDSIIEMIEYTKNKKCITNFVVNDEYDKPLVQITPDINITIPKKSKLMSETVIYGKLERIGGVKPKASLRLKDKDHIVCNLSQLLAESLAPFLYKWIGLRGKAVWSSENYKIIDFTVEKKEDYINSNKVECLNKLKKLVGQYWQDIDDTIDEVNQLREGKL